LADVDITVTLGPVCRAGSHLRILRDAGEMELCHCALQGKKKMPFSIRKLRSALALSILLTCLPAAVVAQTSTTVSLTVTSNGNSVTSVSAGSLVTLTASVTAGSTVLKQGQVSFCDAGAVHCTDIHLLGTAQLTSSGKAQLNLRPGAGIYHYKAQFLGVPKGPAAYAGSVSTAETLNVTGGLATATRISQSGVSGNYTLAASVYGFTKSSGAKAPTGTISFLHATTNNSVLGTGTLASPISKPEWVNLSNSALGNEPSGIVVGDFNNDGNLDFAAGFNALTNALAVYLGDGKGNFTAATSSAISGPVQPLVAADFNQDGILDLVLSNGTVLLGKGDGTFVVKGSPLNFAGGTGGLLPAVTDFNGDGIPDLALGLTVFLGNGDGTFTQAPAITPSSQVLVVSIVAGDFNGDNIPDLAILSDLFGLAVSVFIGNGDGTFTQGPSITVGPFAADLPVTMAAGDFNGDGKLDLAVPNEAVPSLSILLGNGDGTFGPAPSSQVSGATFPNSVIVGDFNGDGIPDLLLGQMTSGTDVFVMLGNGDGTFVSTATGPLNLACCNNTVVGDLNGDGLTDVITADFYVGTAEVFLTASSQANATVNGIFVTGQSPQQAIASYVGDASYEGSLSASTSLLVQATAPVFTPALGIITPAQSITLSSSTTGASIYYEATGALQTNGFVLYNDPIPVSNVGTLSMQAYAVATNYGQSNVSSATYTVSLTNPAPVLSALSPAFTTAGGSAFSITLNGSGFTSLSSAYWGTTVLSTQYVSANQLTAQVPAVEIANPGISVLTVQTPTPGGGVSNAIQFEVASGGAGTAPSFQTTDAVVTQGGTASFPVTLSTSATGVSVECLNLPTGASCTYSASAHAVTIVTSASTPKGTYQITVVFHETVPVASFLTLTLLILPLAAARKKRRDKYVLIFAGATVALAVVLTAGCGGGGSIAPPPPPQTHQVSTSGVVVLTVQ
jgi:hypothetical protein